MTFEQAKTLAHQVGAKVPTYAADAPAAGCWVDRMMWVQSCYQRQSQIQFLGAVGEADRYSGR